MLGTPCSVDFRQELQTVSGSHHPDPCAMRVPSSASPIVSIVGLPAPPNMRWPAGLLRGQFRPFCEESGSLGDIGDKLWAAYAVADAQGRVRGLGLIQSGTDCSRTSITGGSERGADTEVPLVKPMRVTPASPGQAAANKTEVLTPVGGTESRGKDVVTGRISQGKMKCRSVSGLLGSQKQAYNKVGLVVTDVKNGIGILVGRWMEDASRPFLE